MPFDTEFYIEAKFLDEDGILDILDIKGRKVTSQKYTASQIIRVQTHKILSGLYLLQLRGKSHLQTMKLIKK